MRRAAGTTMWNLMVGIVALSLVLGTLAGCSAPTAGATGATAATPTVVAPTQSPDSVAATGEAPIAPAGQPALAPTPTPMVPTPEPTPSAPRPKVIALDPGHGGAEIGAAAAGLAEKDVNLAIAQKLATILREQGYQVVLTRESDTSVSPTYQGGSYSGGLGRDLQARVDIANDAKADLFISIHNNGSADPGQSGTEVWYNEQRPFADRNEALAKLVLTHVVEQIRELGYPVVNRGIKPDTNFRIYRGRPYNIYVLGPGDGARPHTPTLMPGVLGETLFLSNPGDLAMLRQESTLDAIARGYRDAVVAYFEQFPE